MADAAGSSGTGTVASGERRAASGQSRGLRTVVSAATSITASARLRGVLLDDDDEEEEDDDEEEENQREESLRMTMTVGMVEPPVSGRIMQPTLVSRSATSDVANFPRPEAEGILPAARNQRMSSGGGDNGSGRAEMEWGAAEGDEGWMPKPARLHSGKTRSCGVCFAPLQYTAMQSWDEYVQSEEYLQRLQDNLLSDTFISSLICGESTSGGDLPTEHRMHKNRKLKCRQSIHDYLNMTSAGVIDQAYKEKSSVRILEEMLLHGLSTPLFASVLERRLAVISHSTGIARKLMHESQSQTQRMPREVATAMQNCELHHLAIQTLSALLTSFDSTNNSAALQVFEEMARLLARFPALSLYAFWSPVQRAPEKPLVLHRTMVEASSSATTPRLLAAECAIDGSDTSFWQSQPRVGVTYFTIRHAELSKVSSISVRWHLKSFPKTVAVQYRVAGTDAFSQLTEQHASSSSGPARFETRFPRRCEEVRLVLTGTPVVNRSACYAIEEIKLNVPVSDSFFVDPKTTLSDVCEWMLKAIGNANEDVVVEAISALRAWTLATASLGSVLAFVRMLTKVKELYSSSDPAGQQPPGIASFTMTQARMLIRGLQVYCLDEMDRIAKSVGKKPSTESRKVRALFEPSCCSAGVTIEDGGIAVRTRETSYQYAAVNTGISSGRASWKFRLDNDTVDDEMTCFGAAILPVTVSGYDSSPNLWMLRGYNGNLYARGHKLSRSIGKVHPGDTVQIDVDMTEGTLAYKINDTDYGAVFTDLVGHEVFPAVSFYGSGKVITLLGVEKWDDAQTGNSTIDPVFLSNLKEYHFAVGHGTLGKGAQLGYASDADARLATAATTTPNSIIHVAGEAKQRCLSTHPPARGDAFVLYDLGDGYATLTGSVAINDGVQNDVLQQRGVSVVFSIIGDGATLWQSKSLAQVRTLEAFEVNVHNVRMLELRVSCPGSNHCAHAIWVDPYLAPLDEWKCSACSILNKGSWNCCYVCRESHKSVTGTIPSKQDVEQNMMTSCPVGNDRNCSQDSSVSTESSQFDELVNTILAEIVGLTNMGQGTSGQQEGQVKTAIRFEQPYCRQPCDEVLVQLLSMISPLEAGDQVSHQRVLHALGLLYANLQSVTAYDVTPTDLGISKATIAKLKHQLEKIAYATAGPSGFSRELEEAAANALIAGLPMLYTPPQKIQLLLALLRGSREKRYEAHSAKHLILVSMLRTLALPGRDGVLNFLPIPSTLVTSSSQCGLEDADASLSVGDIEEVVLLLISTACSVDESDKDRTIADGAMRLLQSYQLMLLAEALEVTTKKEATTISGSGSSQVAMRTYVQEATINYSALLLRYCGNAIGKLVKQHGEEALCLDGPEAIGSNGAGSKLSARAFHLPILSKLLPWLVSCLCLLRRQSWLAIPILPSVVKFSSAMDHFCAELSTVKAAESRIRLLDRYIKARLMESQQLERMLATDQALTMHHQASKPMYNVFKQLYTGDKDHFEGQIGFQFEATSTFSIIALGRSVNPSKNNGILVRQHAIRLWEESSQALLAQATVGANSRKDAMGYAFEPLVTPVKLTQGKLYRLTTQEFANGGDPWYKKENLPDEEYDASYVKILRDCYASGSTSFPNSQNLSGAAYGVPTFLVEGENPLSKVPRFLAPFGSTLLKFSTKKKSVTTMISHSGTSAHALDGGSDVWRTCYLQTAVYGGVHAVDFAVKCSKPGGISSGHVCVGADWSLANPLVDSSRFLGLTATSVGWMPSIGALWVMGKRVVYGTRKQVNIGDILTMVVDYDHQLLSFAHNGVDMGIALGVTTYAPLCALPHSATSLPSQLSLGISLNGTLDVAHVRPGGVAGSTLRLHWLLDLHNSIASLTGRLCSTLIAGNPVDDVEEELLPWLQSPLLSGGASSVQPSSSSRDELPDWHGAFLAEDARWKDASSLPPTSSSATASVRPLTRVDRVKSESAAAGKPKLVKRSSFFDEIGLEESIFLEDLIKDMGDSGPSAMVIAWLEKASPDRSFLSRLGKFATCERPMCAALIKHSPIHVLHEVQAIISSAKTLDGKYSIDHIDLVPSDDLALIWKRVVMMRHWLIKTRQEYRAKAASDDTDTDSGGGAPGPLNPLEGVNSELEMRIAAPKTFDQLVLQMQERAMFLCILNPPAEERDRMRVESQVALSNLAEKWSAQKTPPSLEPMLERWKSLRESDSSKWAGVVGVLRAQDRWRARRASFQITSGPTTMPLVPNVAAVDEVPNTPVVDEEDDDKLSGKTSKYHNSFAAMLRACDLYIRNGVGAPPEILRALLDRRQRRSEWRVFGLDAMKSLLTSLTMDSTRHSAIIFLRPAFRGFTEDEKESRDMNDGQVIAETFRATVRHHYLKGLEGCSRRTLQRVQRSFWNLYTELANLIAPPGSNRGVSVDSSLKQAIICSWCLDFESRDHSYVLKSGVLMTLQNEFSMGAILQHTHQEMDDLRLLQGARLASSTIATEGSELNWHPLSDEFVQRSALSTGLITKRDIMLLILRAPRFACSRKWWQDNVLISEDASTVTRHTVSAISLRYSELLANLRSKTSWCEERFLGRKVLQFGFLSSVSTGSTHSSGASPSQAKPGQVSYAEVPMVGDVADFTMEMWIYPTELGGYKALWADNRFREGSVYVELLDRSLHVAINGNAPREQLFKSIRFDTHTWTHVAIIYHAVGKTLTLVVNGTRNDVKSYSRVGKSVVFRDARIGCWSSDSGDSSSAVSTAPQRVFKGSIAEVRLWNITRTEEQILRDYQRAIPCDVEKTNDGKPQLLGLWHLDEGEGACSNNRIAPRGRQPSQPPIETLAGCNASLVACHWANANVPVWSTEKIDSLESVKWQRVVTALRSFQRVVRRRFAIQYETIVAFARSTNRREEDTLLDEWPAEEDDQDDDAGLGLHTREELSPQRQALLNVLMASTDDVVLHQKQVKRCAWIVFRFLAHMAICGTQERTDSEATTIAAAAKSRRKLRIQSDGGVAAEVSSPVAGTRPTASYGEDQDVAKTAELASDVAKTAASNRQLEEPVLQMLWFSNEVHRKVFEIIEKELGYATAMIQTAEGLTRGQRMIRSTSTPVKDREIAIRPQNSVLVHGSKKRPQGSTPFGGGGISAAFSTSRGDGVALEPLEVESHVFSVLTFVLSQSTSQVAWAHLARHHMLRELLKLLRIGSPRSQRIVKLILRRICACGAVGPRDVAEILGSEAMLVDLLLDQVAESVCSTAAPIPTVGLSVSSAAATAAAATASMTGDSTSSSFTVAPITESLSNPVGFRSGQVYLAAASESVALLRLLMTDRRWGAVVADLLSVAVKNVTPILARQQRSQQGGPPVAAASSDIRIRTAIIRAVGALCVLGSHTDCLRIGGKVEVTAKETQSDGKTAIDYGFKFANDSSSSNTKPTLATLIELNARSSTARVVFEATDEQSDPNHNVQEVNLAMVSPVEEVQLPSDSAPVLSAEMMPVILKLASLDESDVIASFDDLWRMQIRSRALLAFESILRHYAAPQVSNDATLLFDRNNGIPPSLLEVALTPVALTTFVSVPFLQERGRMILCRLIEASTPFGEPMFRGLPDPKPHTVASNESATETNGAVVEASDDPVEEESEEYRIRRGFASTLAAMGFEFDLCMAALENSRNDPNLAVEWLMGAGAIEYQDRQEARRMAAATLASRRSSAAASTGTSRASRSSGRGGDDMAMEARVEELQSISGMPYRLAYCALEMANGDPNRAMEWLMEHGSRYADKPDSLLLLGDDLRTNKSLSLCDAAALEGIDQPDLLVTAASHETTIDPTAVSTVTSAATTPPGRGGDGNAFAETTTIMAVTLAPILAALPEKAVAPKKKGTAKNAISASTNGSGFAALDPEYLSPYVLLTVSNEVGPVQRLSTTGRTGIFRAFSPKDGVLITFLNTETGAYEDEWHLPKDVRRITRIYDEMLDGVSSIHRVALRTEQALSTHYARRGVAALLRAWGSISSPSNSTSFQGVLAAVGGPRQFTNLLKLVAASEMVFSRKHASTDLLQQKQREKQRVKSKARAMRGKHDEPISILHDLQAIALQILRDEAESGKSRDAVVVEREDTKRSLRAVQERGGGDVETTQLHCGRELESALVSQEGFEGSTEVTSVCDDGDDGDYDDEERFLRHAIAMSMVDATARKDEKVAKEEAKEEEESFMQLLLSGAPRAYRTRQPSYTEAQEVASAYLGGSIDDHDGLLSSVLVQECVSHFVESTRVAGEGTSTSNKVNDDGADVLEFQSLHPYHGRCDYTRAVVLDKSHRAVRVKFDQRCKVGAKTKLTFYADAACEKILSVVDAASTTATHSSLSSVSDLLIHSHQFWFKFSASEDDVTKNHGYGYRFQVKPMQSISWANESEVQTNASLEWACWVLDFLLNDATDLVARGAVHNRKIYGALVRYLRSPGAPFKSRVVRLLIQLLHEPERFPVAEIPDLEPLEGISSLAIAQAKQEKEAGKVFLPAQLLQLVELAIVTRRAAHVLEKARVCQQEESDSRRDHGQEAITSASLVLPRSVESKEVPKMLHDLMAIASFLLGHSDELAPHVLMAVWLDVYGCADIIETAHPYSASCQLKGTIDFPGATSLLATFDSRCATVSGAELQLRITPDASTTAAASSRGAWAFSGSELWPSGAVDLSGGSGPLTFMFQGNDNPDARFGVSVSVSAVGLSPEQQLARVSEANLHDLLRVLHLQRSGSSKAGWTASMDSQLVDWVNTTVESSIGTGANASTAGSLVSVEFKPSEIRLHRTRDALRCSQLLDTSLTQLQLRFALLKHFNQHVKRALPLLDLRDTSSPWTVAHTLRQLGHCIFFDIKNALVEAAIEATSMPGDTNNSNNTAAARITLDRLQALESRDDREVEPSVSDCFFAQAFRQLHHQVEPTLFRRKIDNKGRLFSVKFRGEEGVDWGGVYREGVNSMVDDLFSSHFNLFVLCPNGQHDTGTNRAMYLPNPKCTSPIAIQMYEFVGKLLGISLRTRGDFPFAFPSLVWKSLICEPLDRRADLENTDAMFVQMLDGLCHCEKDGIFNKDEFDAAFDGLELKFTAFDCNGHEVELVEDGKTTRVEYDNRLEYCQLAEAYRLQESSKQIAAMQRGLATIFPLRVLTILTWHEMEMLTCGSPKIDIALWKQHTRYDGYNENDDTVKLFWEAMASFNDEQRSDFVRFAWGRSRLPRGKWPQPFKLTKKGGRDSTLSLPVAHTCFFSVELPPYTTLDKMTSMLLATINFGLGGILMA